MALTLEILLVARNEAAQGLDAANRDIKKALGEIEDSGKRSGQALARTTQTINQEFGQVTRVTRALAGEVTTALNPALGAMVGSLGDATTATRGLGAAQTALVAGLVIGGAALAQYIRIATDAADKQAALNIAVRRFDATAIRTQIDAATRGLEEGRERVARFTRDTEQAIPRFLRNLRNMFNEPLLRGDFLGAVREAGRQITGQTQLLEQLAKARAALPAAMRIEQELQITTALREQEAAVTNVLKAELQLAAERADEGEYLRISRQIEESLAAQYSLLRQSAEAQHEQDLARAREQGPAQIEAVNKALQDRLLLLNTSHLAEQRQLEQERRREQLEIRGRRLQTREVFQGAEERIGGTPEDVARGRQIIADADERALAARIELVQVQQQLVELGTQQEGLSQAEQESREATVLAARQQLRVQEAILEIERARATGIPAKEDIARARLELIQTEGAIQAANLQQRALERTDLFAGIAKGFRDLQDDMESFGRQGERIVKDFATSTSGFFEDLLFGPLEKGWKKTLEEVPLQLAKSLGRILTDTLAKFAVNQLISGVSKVFPSVAGLVGGGTAVAGIAAPGLATSAAAAPAFSANALQTGVTAIARITGTATPAGQVAGAPNLDITGIVAMLGQAGALTPEALSALSAIGPSGTGSAFTAGLSSQAFGAAFGGAEVAPSFMSQLGGMLTAAAPYLGAAGAALGLGFTVYGALQGRGTTQEIITSGVSGAVTGATLAASLATIAASLGFAAPSFGISLAIGAVVGGALGAGAASVGKGGGITAGGRAEARSNIGNRTYDEMASAIASGTSPEQVAKTRIHTGNTVGGLLRRIAEYNITGFVSGDPWNWPANPALSQPVIESLAALGIASEEFSEGGGGGERGQTGLTRFIPPSGTGMGLRDVLNDILAVPKTRGGVGSVGELIASFGGIGNAAAGAKRAADLLRGWNDMLTAFERALEQASRNTPVSYVDQGTTAGVGAVRVQSFLPASRLGELSGRDLAISADAWRNLSPFIYEVILRRLTEIDRDHQLGAWDRRRFSGEI